MRTLVTGSSGFLGQHVFPLIQGAVHSVMDATWQPAVRDGIRHAEYNAIVHLAAVVGGIETNSKNPASFFFDNVMINTILMEEAWRAGVKKFLSVSSACAYPRICPMPMKEEYLWDGFPEPTNASYGLAKRLLVHQSAAYREQYGLNAICLILANMYGPGDHFNNAKSHVIPALITRMVEAKESGAAELTVWGSGTPTRDFLYVEDAAEAIVLALETYNSSQPINIGSGKETSILEVAMAIKEAVGYEGKLVFDPSKPDGQPRRVLDTTRAKTLLGWEAKTSLKDGIQKTVDSFLAKVK